MTSVVVLTGGGIGPRMSGPGLRAWHIARVLVDAGHRVVLATTGAVDDIPAPFAVERIRPGDERAFRGLEARGEVIVVQGLGMRQFRGLRRTRRVLVADLYDPMHLEQLEQTRALSPRHAESVVERAIWIVDEQLAAADLVLCASERQRSFYLGHLAALGRIVPATYRHDPELARMIAVAPYGLDAEPPRHEHDAIRGIVPGITAEDRLLIWAGGIWEWFDPETLVRAIAVLAARRPAVRLLFLGASAPGMPDMPVVARTRALAEELGVLGRSVFLQEGWVEWADRQNHLTEADAGVSTHHPHLETEYAFRTRVLDYLWAGLPMVLTVGDAFAELVEREGLGIVVAPGDVEALASALERVLFDDDFAAACRGRIAAVRADFTWERALTPLVALAAAPRHAADRPDGRRLDPVRALRGLRVARELPRGGRIGRAARLLRRHGIRSLWQGLRDGGGQGRLP